MHREVGVCIGAGCGNLCKDRLLDHQFATYAYDSLGQARYQIRTKLLVCNQIQRCSEGREVVVRDWRSTAQRTLRHVKTLIGPLRFGNRRGGIDGDQDGQRFWSLLEESP